MKVKNSRKSNSFKGRMVINFTIPDTTDTIETNRYDQPVLKDVEWDLVKCTNVPGFKPMVHRFGSIKFVAIDDTASDNSQHVKNMRGMLQTTFNDIISGLGKAGKLTAEDVRDLRNLAKAQGAEEAIGKLKGFTPPSNPRPASTDNSSFVSSISPKRDAFGRERDSAHYTPGMVARDERPPAFLPAKKEPVYQQEQYDPSYEDMKEAYCNGEDWPEEKELDNFIYDLVMREKQEQHEQGKDIKKWSRRTVLEELNQALAEGNYRKFCDPKTEYRYFLNAIDELDLA